MASGKKVLIVCDKNPFTSFGRLAEDSLEALKQRGYEGDILWLADKCSGLFSNRKVLADRLKVDSFDVVFLIHSGIGYLIPKIRKVQPGAKTVVMVHDTFWNTLYPHSLKFFLFRKFFANLSRSGFYTDACGGIANWFSFVLSPDFLKTKNGILSNL